MQSTTDRRAFLKTAAGGVLAGGAARLVDCAETSTKTVPHERRKLIVVVFGGGTRSSETIDDPKHAHIRLLWNKMIPRGTLLDNMRVEHRVVHPNSTGSIMTGHWEWDDIDWSRPVANPTIFEIARKTRDAPDTAAWAFVYASILSKAGRSRAKGFGERFAANVVEPPTIPRTTADKMGRLIAEAAATGDQQKQLEAARLCAKLAKSDSRATNAGLRSEVARKWFDQQYKGWRESDGTTSHDAFLTDGAMACMKRFSPDVLTVAFGEIDCAHYGSWSRYTEAIERTDELTWRLWQAAETLPEYKGRTLMLILPDHGRELDTPDGPGFIHHSDFYKNTGADEGCRRVWMLALGPGVAAGKRIQRPTPITTAAATGLNFLGMDSSAKAAKAAIDLS
jgi:hypothetical protein